MESTRLKEYIIVLTKFNSASITVVHIIIKKTGEAVTGIASVK